MICRLRGRGGGSGNNCHLGRWLTTKGPIYDYLFLIYDILYHIQQHEASDKSPRTKGYLDVISRGAFHKTCHKWQMTVFVISYWNPCFWLVISRFVTDFRRLSLKKGFVKQVPRKIRLSTVDVDIVPTCSLRLEVHAMPLEETCVYLKE